MVLQEKHPKPSEVAWALSHPEPDGSLSVYWVLVEVLLESGRWDLASWAQSWFGEHIWLHAVAKILMCFDWPWWCLSHGNLAELSTVIFFIKNSLSLLQFCFYCNTSHDEVARMWSSHLYFTVGGKNREGDKEIPCSWRHCVGESTRAKWGFPSHVFAQGGISAMTHFSHLFELTKYVHDWRWVFLSE